MQICFCKKRFTFEEKPKIMIKNTIAFLFFITAFAAFTQKPILKPTIGIADNIANDSTITAAGYSCIVENLSKWISPKTVTDEQFIKNIEIFKSMKTPIYAFNIFIPGELKLVGPNVNETLILEYVEKVMARLSQTDTKMIVRGSGGSRRLPDGFDKDVAVKQFVSNAKKIAKLGKKYNIILALESLNTTECNFITTV